MRRVQVFLAHTSPPLKMKGNRDDDDKSEAASLVAEVQSVQVQVYDPTTGDVSKIGTYCGSILCVITRWSSHRCYIYFTCVRHRRQDIRKRGSRSCASPGARRGRGRRELTRLSESFRFGGTPDAQANSGA